MISMSPGKSLVPMMAAPLADEISVSDLFGILRRRRTLIILTIIILTIPPTLLGFLLPPKYTSAASVMIETPASIGTGIESGRQGLSPDAATIETQANVIQSRPLIVQVMEEMDLFRDPEFLPDMETGETASLLDPLRNMVADAQQAIRNLPSALAGGPKESGEVLRSANDEARRIATAAFEDRLSVSQAGKSYVLQIAFTSTDPVKAAAISNRLSTLYVQRQLQDKIAAVQKSELWRTEWLKIQHREALEAEQRLAEFRVEQQLAANRDAVLTPVQLEELERELTKTRSAQTKTEAKLSLIHNLQANGGRLDVLAEAIASPLITQLRMQEVDLIRRSAEIPSVAIEAHPKTIAMREEMAKLTARANQEIDRIIESLRNESDIQSAQANALEKQLQAAKGKTIINSTAAIRLQEMERDAQAKRSAYEASFREYQQANARQGNIETGARIISAAEIPSKASTPSPAIFAAVGLTASALLGSLLALLREQTDHMLRSSRQIEQRLQVPCLAVVPSVKTSKQVAKLHEALHGKPRAAYTQSIRGLYADIDVAAPNAKVILVTSSLPKEGKTTLAASLAICSAQEGVRTVLVEFDLWNPQVANIFGLRAPLGVADLIAVGGDPKRNLDQALVIDQSSGVDILPAGEWGHKTTPTLIRQQVSALLDELGQRYDRIVIDSPPVLAVSDGRVLTPFSDVVLFAVRWGRTSRDAAVAGLQILRGSSATVLGAVLTRVDPKKYRSFAKGDSLQYQHSLRKYYVE